jgi:hypothetical protein
MTVADDFDYPNEPIGGKLMISNGLRNRLRGIAEDADITPDWESMILQLMESSYSEGFSDGLEEGRYQESYANSMSYLGD